MPTCSPRFSKCLTITDPRPTSWPVIGSRIILWSSGSWLSSTENMMLISCWTRWLLLGWLMPASCGTRSCMSVNRATLWIWSRRNYTRNIRLMSPKSPIPLWLRKMSVSRDMSTRTLLWTIWPLKCLHKRFWRLSTVRRIRLTSLRKVRRRTRPRRMMTSRTCSRETRWKPLIRRWRCFNPRTLD